VVVFRKELMQLKVGDAVMIDGAKSVVAAITPHEDHIEIALRFIPVSPDFCTIIVPRSVRKKVTCTKHVKDMQQPWQGWLEAVHLESVKIVPRTG